EDVDGPVAVGHRVAPDLLVDLLALDHLTVGLGEELEQLELASGETDALAADESLVLVGPDLELAGDEGTDVLTRRRPLAPADDPLNPSHDLLGMGWLADPVVGPEAQAADPLGHRRL